MGIWHSWQTTSLRGNRFYRRPERSHCFGLSLFRQSSLKQECATSMRSNALLKGSSVEKPDGSSKSPKKLPKSSIRSKIKNLEERELHDFAGRGRLFSHARRAKGLKSISSCHRCPRSETPEPDSIYSCEQAELARTTVSR